MINEVLSNNFNININKVEEEIPPIVKEVISNSFNININKTEEEVPPIIKEVLSNNFNININKVEEEIPPIVKEVISNSFNININKTEEEVPPIIKEIVSNSFNLVINKGEVIPPEDVEALEEALKNYILKLKGLRGKMQEANNKISENVFDLKTHEDIFNKLTDNGKKKAIIMENGELYINATYVRSGLLEGCMIRTVKGGTGKHIHMEEGAYTAYDGTNPKAYLGFKNPIESNKASDMAFLAMGHDGVGGTSPYIVMQDYPATYNPIGLKMAYAELAYQFYDARYSSMRFLGNGSMEFNVQDYFSVGTYQSGSTREEILHVKKKNGKGCIGTGSIETEYIETVGINTDTVNSTKPLILMANDKSTGVVLYSTGTKSFEPMDGQAGQIYCGTSWSPWRGVYSNNSYSSDGVVVSDTNTISDEEVAVGNAIDKIKFVSPINEDNKIVMDVTDIKDTNFVEVDEEGNVSKNDSELIKLLILEVQKLKKEIETLKAR